MYQHNLQRDVIGLLSTGGTQVMRYRYDAWGRQISCVVSLAGTLGVVNPFRYRGYVFDEETGLYYLRSRYYNPVWGRFLNADTLLGDVGGLLSHNTFVYCNNSPVDMHDPNGKSSVNAEAFSSLGPWGVVIALLLMAYDAYQKSEPARKLPSQPVSRPRLKMIEGGLNNPNPSPGPQPTANIDLVLMPKNTPTKRPLILFPKNPYDFKPLGLKVDVFSGTTNGIIIKWSIPGTKTSMFEWNEDLRYGSHYHIREIPEDIHFWPGDEVPEPYSSIFFPR